MKINVNVYNEILSYEGTPVELAEFMSYGVFGEWVPAEEMLDCGYEDEDEYEDCGCNEENATVETEDPNSYEVIIDETPSDIEVYEDEVESTPEVFVDEPAPNDKFDPKDSKMREHVRREIRKVYPDLSNKEFDLYYDVVADWMNVFENLEFLKQK